MRKTRLNKKQREIVNEVIDLVNSHKDKDIPISRQYLCRDLGIIKETAVKDLFGSFAAFKAIVQEKLKFNPEASAIAEAKAASENKASGVEELEHDISYSDLFQDGWIDKDKYYWHPKTRRYLFDLKSSYIVLTEAYILKVLKYYTSGDSESTIEIARKLNTSPQILSKVVRALKIAHVDLPITDEMLVDKSDDVIVEDLLTERRIKIYNKVEDESLKDLQKDASMWRLCKHREIDPCLKALGLSKEMFKTHPPVAVNIAKPKLPTGEDETLCVCLSDLHFGALAHSENLSFADNDLNLEYTRKAVENYVQQIIAMCESRGVMPKNCVVMSVGDIIHTLTGMTSRGTAIEADRIGTAQWYVALETLSSLFASLSKLFNNVSCYSVPGNHDRVGDILLFTALQYQFSKSNVSVHSNSSRWSHFYIGNNAFVFEHGESAKYRCSKTPSAGPKRDAFVLNVFNNICNDMQIPQVKRYYITGHWHSFSWQTCRGYEAISLPTINPPDEYADELGYADDNAHQVCFIIDANKGITELWRLFPNK